jgi:NhaP-type Na+/H+ or K+/H+ antiporter
MHSVNPALLTMVAATAVGLLAQVLAARWRIPAIVPLLVFGMVLGPSGLNFIRPQELGTGLSVVVKLSVAVILFQGALNLRLGDLGHALREVRSLVTIGVAVTWIGATLAAWWIAGLSLRVAIVFGALLTVTGPTVVQPILRRVRLPRQIKTILEGEAILIDPIGAVLAIAVVDVVLGLAGVRPIGILGSIWGYAGRLIVGAAVGAAAAIVLSWLLKRRGAIPDELSNLVSLAFVWGAYAVAELLQGESGIMAVVAMGLTMQHGAVPEERRLRQFKEQLTVLGISLLFVLLSANLPLSVVRAEGVRGLLTVAALMFIVRPVSVWCALHRTDLTWRDRAFISWISPRGVVAASVASLFALELTEAGFPEGERILALTFLTIAATVVVQGLTVGPVARLLRLENFSGRKVIVVGAGPLARELAEILRRYDRPVTLIDRNPTLVDDARRAGFDAVAGNALDEDVLTSAGADDSETVVALTTNSEVNALAAHLAHDAFGVATTYPALADPAHGASAELLSRVGGHLAFGRPIDVREWDFAFGHGQARTVAFRVPAGVSERARVDDLPPTMVALARVRQRIIEIATGSQTWRGDDHVVIATTLPENEATETLQELTVGVVPDAR